MWQFTKRCDVARHPDEEIVIEMHGTHKPNNRFVKRSDPLPIPSASSFEFIEESYDDFVNGGGGDGGCGGGGDTQYLKDNFYYNDSVSDDDDNTVDAISSLPSLGNSNTTPSPIVVKGFFELGKFAVSFLRSFDCVCFQN